MVYHTWKARNAKIFRKIRPDETMVIEQMKKELQERVQGASDTKKGQRCIALIQRICN